MIDILFRRLIQLVNDPRERNIPFAAADPNRKQWGWYEPVKEVVEPFAGLLLLVPGDDKPGAGAREITHGDVANALIGMNWIRLEYPMLDFNCRIVDDLAERVEEKEIGFLAFFFEGDDEDGGVSTVKMVR
ncbi:MAG: hypothetical protein Q9171_001691 [Xanthocarpia ochracea]